MPRASRIELPLRVNRIVFGTAKAAPAFSAITGAASSQLGAWGLEQLRGTTRLPSASLVPMSPCVG
jgi:hypothetical protein